MLEALELRTFALAVPLAESEWGAAVLPFLAGLAVVLAGAIAFGVWGILARLDKFDALTQKLEALEQIRSALQALAKERSDLDLRRIEHVLIEMRDGQRRLEDAILRATQNALQSALQATRSGAHDDPGAAALANPDDPAQRILARVLAQGFERVQIVPDSAEIQRLIAAGGLQEVLVEARRNGVLCKGRVLLRDGAVTDVELTPAYTMFP
jgi:hypothetical protein